MGTTIKSTLENIPLREWPLNAAFVALIRILGLKNAQNTKIRALSSRTFWVSRMKAALVFVLSMFWTWNGNLAFLYIYGHY